MTIEHSASLVTKLSLNTYQNTSLSYYRSKLFTSPSTTNPLVAAAGPLLSLLERLCMSSSLPPIETIRENIAHELHAFHGRLQGKDHAEDINILANYLLSATIDELIGKSYLRVYEQNATFQAFTPLSSDDKGPEVRFFDIVTYIKERPHQYLDLIELAYYCLITGFEGHFHAKTDARLALDNLLEELFQLITRFRVNKPHSLFKERPQAVQNTPQPYRPLIIVALTCISLLLTGSFLSSSILKSKVNNLPFTRISLITEDE